MIVNAELSKCIFGPIFVPIQDQGFRRNLNQLILFTPKSFRVCKYEAHSIIFYKFSYDEPEPVKEVKKTCEEFSCLSNLRADLRSLLWVEFETPTFIILDET